MTPNTHDHDVDDCDVTIEENVRSSISEASITNEKFESAQVEEHEVAQGSDGDFPDGGLRAWLIVAGVRLISRSIYWHLV